MGFFRRDRITTVVAAVQPLDSWRTRPNLLASMVVDQTLFNTYSNMGEAYIETFINGVGRSITKLPDRALKQEYYSATGQTPQSTVTSVALDRDVLAQALGLTVVTDYSIDAFELSYFVEQWLLANHPEDIDTYTKVETEDGYVTFTGSTDYSFLYPVEEGTGNYLYASGLTASVEEPVGEPDIESLTLEEIPEGWDLVTEELLLEWEDEELQPDSSVLLVPKSQVVCPGSQTVVHREPVTTVTAEDDEEDVPDESTLFNRITEFREVEYTLEEVVDNGLTAYVVTETITVRTTYQTVKFNPEGEPAIAIYQYGAGNSTLDSLMDSSAKEGMYYPVIPVIVDIAPGDDTKKGTPKLIDKDNVGLSGLHGLYTRNKKLTRKVLGQKGYDQLIKGLADSVADALRMRALKPTMRTILWGVDWSGYNYNNVDSEATVLARRETYLPTVPELKPYDTRAKLIQWFKDEFYDIDLEADPPTLPNYSYVVFGTSINSKDPLAHRYMWEFFKNQYEIDSSVSGMFSSYIANISSTQAAWNSWKNYANSHKPSDKVKTVEWGGRTPQFGEVDTSGWPTQPTSPTLRTKKITLKTSSAINARMEFTFSGVVRTTGKGTGKAGQVTVEKDVNYSLALTGYKLESSTSTRTIFGDPKQTEYTKKYSVVSFTQRTPAGYIRFKYWHTDTDWEAYTVYAPKMKSLVHWGKSVEVSLKDAFDTELYSGDSPLIVPTNSLVFKSMGLVNATHFGVSSLYLVNHYYTDRRQKWYEMGIFKVAVVVVAIAAAVITAPAGGVGAGAVIAAYVGLTGVMATILAVLINIAIAMLISRIISGLSKKLFGDLMGSIIAAVVSAVVTAGISSLASTGSFNLLSQFTAQNLVNLTVTGLNGFNQYQKQQLASALKDAKELTREMQAKQDELNDLIATMDTSTLVDFTKMAKAELVEPLEVFLARTLMTGSDIAEVSLKGLEVSLDLDLQLEAALK